MTEPMRIWHARLAWNRVVALSMIVTLLLSSPLAGPRPARAALAAQAQNLCKLVPPGYDPATVTDMEDYCFVTYNEADGSIVFYELSRAYSPAVVHDLMVSCHPSDCASGGACEGRPCQILDWGDAAPAGRDKGLRGVVYDPTTSQKGGLAYAFTRGCYLLEGKTLDTTDDSKAYLWNRMLQADALVGTDPCAGCEDLAACQGTGSGGTSSVCGPGVAAPPGPFDVSINVCRYEESTDGLTCQALPVNVCPNTRLKYTWSLDGSVVPGYETDLFNPTDLGLCAGTHTVTVQAEDTQNNLKAIGVSVPFTSTKGAPCGSPSTALTISALNCYYSSTEDSLRCVAQMPDAWHGASLLFEWRLDGKLLGETTESLVRSIPPDGQPHTIQVVANHPATDVTSALASYSFKAAAGAGSIQVQTASGTTSLGGSDTQTSLTLSPEDEAVQIFLACPDEALLLLLIIDLHFRMGGSPGTDEGNYDSSTKILVELRKLNCLPSGRSERPLQVAAVGDPSLYLPAQAAGDDLPVRLWIGHQGGPLHVSAASDQVSLDVQTAVATVHSAGQNDFGVNYNTQTGETAVATYGGSVEVYSSSTGAQVAVLGAGQQVAVAADGTATGGPGGTSTGAGGTGASVVGPYGETSGQPQGSTAAALRRLPSKTALAGIALAVLLLCVAVVGVLRRRSAGARPAAAAPPVQAAPLPPVRAASPPRAQAMLVVLQGSASRPSLALAGGEAILGRDRACALVLDDALVSARHASVAWDGSAWVLTDLGSTNGTFVNGMRIKRQELNPGDAIQLGATRLAFQAQA